MITALKQKSYKLTRLAVINNYKIKYGLNWSEKSHVYLGEFFIMNGLETKSIQCPYCWETFESVIDCSVDEQEYVEDCYVCCRPIVFRVKTDGYSVIELNVSAENQ